MSVQPDQYGTYHVDLDPKWTGGPTKLELEIDEVAFGVGLIVKIDSQVTLNEDTIEIAPLGDIHLPKGTAFRSRLTVLGNLEAARTLRDSLVALVADMENVTEHGWETRT